MIARLILSRVVLAIATLAALSLAAFLLTTSARGDPALLALRQDGQDPSPSLLADYRARLGLDAPLPARYARWATGVVQGDLGRSFLSNRPVAQVLGERIGATLALGALALTVSTAAGLAIGTLLAFGRHPALELPIRACLVVLGSVPAFWVGIAAAAVFGENLHLLPVAGSGTWQHFVLPTFTLALGPTAALVRLTRALLLEEMSHDYLLTARSKGVRERVVAVRHLLPNVAQPLLALVSVRLGHILGGAVIIESIFAWPGMGSVLITAISGRDLPVIGGYVLVTGILVITSRLASDVLGALIDPRISPGMELSLP